MQWEGKIPPPLLMGWGSCQPPQAILQLSKFIYLPSDLTSKTHFLLSSPSQEHPALLTPQPFTSLKTKYKNQAPTKAKGKYLNP